MVDLQKMTPFEAHNFDIGIDQHGSRMLPYLALDAASYNMSGGEITGLGVRPGMAPLAGHADTEPPEANQKYMGLRASEEDAGVIVGEGLASRKKLFGIVDLKLGSFDELKARDKFYAVIVSVRPPLQFEEVIDCLLLSRLDNGFIAKWSPDLRDGLPDSTDEIYDPFVFNFLTELVQAGSDTEKQDPLIDLREIYGGFNPTPQMHGRIAVLATSGRDVPMYWVFGDATTDGDVTHAPNITLTNSHNITQPPFDGDDFPVGMPSSINLQNYKIEQRTVTVYPLTSSARWVGHSYRVTFAPTSLIYVATPGFDYNVSTMTFSGVTAVKDGPGTSYNNTEVAVVNDDALFTNSSYQAVLIAGAGVKPLAVIFQDWARSASGQLQQWVDLIDNPFAVRPFGTQNLVVGAATSKKPTAIANFPDFNRGTAMATGVDFAFGPAGSGTLLANTTYELTYAIYNKRLDFESNVGAPVIFQTGTVNLVYLQLQKADETSLARTTLAAQMITTPGSNILPFPSFAPDSLFLNYIEYRFYYRPEGSFEWLPALFVDAVKWWFAPKLGAYAACVGPIGALPGGQPGGFNDYSRLAPDQYIDVVTYRSRAFWCSSKAVVFSLTNNVFAYPGRNSIAAPTGEFRGLTVHNYPGQSEQASRLIIWGSAETYIARFTGIRTQAAVRVSSDTVGNFDLDASDLVVEPWTKQTSFSGRSAVIADGWLYFWGPEGIFLDKGNDTPDPIDGLLHVDRLYDPSKTAEIHAVFDTVSKNITWFYPPKVPDEYLTHGLQLNIETGKFRPQRYKEKIDASFNLNSDTTGMTTAGKRSLIIHREDASASVQRAVYHDGLCTSGDFNPPTELMVKSFSSPTTRTRLLTLAAGYDAAALASITVGDYLTFSQLKAYAMSLTNAPDMIAKVTAVGAGTITVRLPDDVTMDAAASLDQNDFFPVYHGATVDAASDGLHDIPYLMKTRYWMAGGPRYNWWWHYTYMMFQLDKLPSVDPQFIEYSHRTPVSSAEVSDPIEILDNSDGTWQVLKNNRQDERANEGQAFQFSLSGRYIGSRWTLQMAEMHCTDNSDNQLKEFEG